MGTWQWALVQMFGIPAAKWILGKVAERYEAAKPVTESATKILDKAQTSTEPLTESDVKEALGVAKKTKK